MVTSGFNIHPAIIRPVAAGFALAGYYLLGCGLFDLFIDHNTAELFNRVIRPLISKAADEERFFNAVSYRLLMGVILMALAWVLDRLHRWWQKLPD